MRQILRRMDLNRQRTELCAIAETVPETVFDSSTQFVLGREFLP